MRDRLGRKTGGHDTHGLDGDLDLLRPRVDRRLVDLDVGRAGPLQIARFVAHDLGEGEHGVAARRVRLVVRPVEHRVWAGEHSLNRAIGERLRVLEVAHRQRLRAAHLPLDDGLVVVAIPVGPHQPADAEALEPLREERHHVAAVHLAVHQHVEPDLLLPPDPFSGGLALELLELRPSQLSARVLRAGLQQVIRLPEGAHGRRRQDRRWWLSLRAQGPLPLFARTLRLDHASTSCPAALRAPWTSAASFARATLRGRYSSEVVGAIHRRSCGTRRRARST